jgi:hypothetical protein
VYKRATCTLNFFDSSKQNGNILTVVTPAPGAQLARYTRAQTKLLMTLRYYKKTYTGVFYAINL